MFKNRIICNKDTLVKNINDLMLYQVAAQYNNREYTSTDTLDSALNKFKYIYHLDNYEIGNVQYKSGIIIRGFVRKNDENMG